MKHKTSGTPITTQPTQRHMIAIVLFSSVSNTNHMHNAVNPSSMKTHRHTTYNGFTQAYFELHIKTGLDVSFSTLHFTTNNHIFQQEIVLTQKVGLDSIW